MRNMHALGLSLALAIAIHALGADAATPPKIDKARWEAYIRYIEGYMSGVKFAIEDPKPSPVPGYYQVAAHLSMGENRLERIYYVTGDGQSIINGTVWDVRQAPFAETIKQLPKDGHSFGPADAPVTIVVFSDYQCPFCSQFAKTMRTDLPKKYPAQVRVIFKDFPLTSIHPWARAAAETSQCLGAQKSEAFWAFHDWIFEHQKEVTPENFREKVIGFSRERKLDETALASCLDKHATAAEVEKSVQLAQQMQVQQTPTFFINGRMETGSLAWERLDPLVEFELHRPKEFAPGSGEKCCEVNIPKVGQK